MPTTSTLVRTRQLSRDKLALFLPTPELIKAFENLQYDVQVTLTEAIDINAGSFEFANTLAQMADNHAAYALASSQRVRQLTEQLEALLHTARSNNSALDDLRRRLDVIEQLVLG